jgi:hypothetical protein
MRILGLRAAIRSMPTLRRHSVMMRSAHSASETKIVGLPIDLFKKPLE